MKLALHPTRLSEVIVFEPRVFADERGYFMETWNQRDFDAALGRSWHFVQDNHSRSHHAVLRGLHYQTRHAQGKLVRVTAGRVFDVAVDMRRSSATLGQWAGVELSAENKRQLWIPPGFAHGFVVLSEFADSSYKTTAHYMPEHERTVAWDDPHIGVQWPLHELKAAPILSDKDRSAPAWAACELAD